MAITPHQLGVWFFMCFSIRLTRDLRRNIFIMAGKEGAVLEHTYSSLNFQNVL